jgi:hypothetical protein
MNKTAPAFFGRLNDALWNEVLLDICLLTDKPQKYLTVHQLLSNLPPQSSLREPLCQALARVESATRFARDWRDRRLAHRDRDHARDPSAKPLKPASRASTEAALESLRDLMNLVDHHFGGDGIQYEHSIEPLGGAGSLLLYLDGGLEAEQHRRETRDFRWRPRHL